MQRVTGMDAHHWPMDDDKETRFAQWRSEMVAGSHVLTKSPGGVVTATWVVTNTGGTTGQAGMNIAHLGSLVFIGPAVNIPANSSRTLTGTWTIPAGATGTLTADVDIVDVGAARVIATHPFTVNIPAPAGPILSASPAGPTIT